MDLELWLNAFIPRDIPGYTKTIMKGQHAGKTAIPLPSVARLAQYPTKDWDAGYLTDQRSFSSNPRASVRMQSYMKIRLDSNVRLISAPLPTTSGTTEIDMETGKQLGYADADMSRCLSVRLISANSEYYFHPKYRPPLVGSTGYLKEKARTKMGSDFPLIKSHDFYIEGAARDPLIFGSSDIDYCGVFTVAYSPKVPDTCHIKFDGYIDEFPAFECYASFNGNTKLLFQVPPPKGNTVMSLPGHAFVKVNNSISFGKSFSEWLKSILNSNLKELENFMSSQLRTLILKFRN